MTLHERIAKALGWTVEETQSFALQALREMVRPVDVELAREITEAISSGATLRRAP